MSKIPDYSQIENFNLAAIAAVRENTRKDDIKDGQVLIKYSYKGRLLEVNASVVLWGCMGEEALLESVNVTSVNQVKGHSNE